MPYPIEYKRGGRKSSDADILQLCAQVMSTEEMLCCRIPEGALYYGEKKHREPVNRDKALRYEVSTFLIEMHEMMTRGQTPKVKTSKSCAACSLKEICMPQLIKKDNASDYITSVLKELGL